MQNFLEEFKSFALKGNVLDLAVGVVIGTAFNKIVDSFVNDIVMQAIAAVFKQPDFGTIAWHVNGGAIRIGAFINNIVNFIVVALSVFVAVKAINKLSRLHFHDVRVPFMHAKNAAQANANAQAVVAATASPDVQAQAAAQASAATEANAVPAAPTATAANAAEAGQAERAAKENPQK
jgi:large conductance mechanosensitive channel